MNSRTQSANGSTVPTPLDTNTAADLFWPRGTPAAAAVIDFKCLIHVRGGLIVHQPCRKQTSISLIFKFQIPSPRGTVLVIFACGSISFLSFESRPATAAAACYFIKLSRRCVLIMRVCVWY